MIVLFSFIAGTLIGSFLNVCIYRIPRSLSLIWPCSTCPHCGRPIPFYHIIPLLSFILLKGRCATCKEPISYQYPFVEFISGLLTAVFVLCLGMTKGLPYYLLFLYFLIVISVIDLQIQLIPDRVLIVMAGTAFLLNLMLSVISCEDAFLGFTIGGMVMYLFARFGAILFRKEVLGMGDVKFSAVAGFIVGWKIILIALYIGFVLALFSVFILRLFRRFQLDQPIPLGPFLSLGLVVCICAGEELINFVSSGPWIYFNF